MFLREGEGGNAVPPLWRQDLLGSMERVAKGIGDKNDNGPQDLSEGECNGSGGKRHTGSFAIR
jgi:hypothetical protein